MNLTDAIGYVAGLLLTLSFLPQVIKTYQLKHARDVSMGMLALIFGSGIGYEIYSWRLGLMPVVIMNGIFTILVAIEIGLKIVYDRREVLAE